MAGADWAGDRVRRLFVEKIKTRSSEHNAAGVTIYGKPQTWRSRAIGCRDSVYMPKRPREMGAAQSWGSDWTHGTIIKRCHHRLPFDLNTHPNNPNTASFPLCSTPLRHFSTSCSSRSSSTTTWTSTRRRPSRRPAPQSLQARTPPRSPPLPRQALNRLIPSTLPFLKAQNANGLRRWVFCDAPRSCLS